MRLIMITTSQEIVCGSCIFHKFIASPISRDFDRIICKAKQPLPTPMGCTLFEIDESQF